MPVFLIGGGFIHIRVGKWDILGLLGLMWYLWVFFSFNYSVLFCVLTLRFYVFVVLVRVVSYWVGLIFFLVYIGALLVLFFFIFSLSKNEGLRRISYPVWVLVLRGGLVALGVVKDYNVRSRGVYYKCKEVLVTVRDFIALVGLITFICLVVWSLSQIKTVNQVPLRPFN